MCFLRRKDGIAAVEFALILPLMALLFFGMLEASDLLTVKRRISNAGNSLVDIISQEPTVRIADVNDAIVGVKRLLEPTDTSSLAIRVVSVVRGPLADDPVTVHWSVDADGDAPYPAGSVYAGLDRATTVRSEASLLVVEMDYEYVPAVGGRVFRTPFSFYQTAKRWPRKSSRVQLCATSNPASCTS